MDNSESIYTREDLDSAIKQVVPSFRNTQVWKIVGRCKALESAIIEIFVDWDSWHNEYEVIDVIRAAMRDLREYGQFNFLDSE